MLAFIIFFSAFLLLQGSIDNYCLVALLISLGYLRLFFIRLNKTLAFRELVLLMYSINFLLSPALTYLIQDSGFEYGMNISPFEYFSLTIPSIFLLHFGMFISSCKLFKIDLKSNIMGSFIDHGLLIWWMIIGVILTLLSKILPSELAYLVYLIAMIKYVAAYALYILNKSRFRLLLAGLLLFEVFIAIYSGMFGELFLWVAFSFLLWCFLEKPSITKKLFLFIGGLFIFMVIQSVKGDYRQKTWVEGQEAGISSFSKSSTESFDVNTIFSKEQIIYSLSRLNQGWILSSTIGHMNSIQDYQGLELVKLYIEAAVLPRALAPNKLISGDKEIFNRFSGHQVSGSTSMSLGVFADGYVAYGNSGVFWFAFCLGLIFFGVFKIVENWTDLSPFFILFLYPIFFYAIRPDCETQTLLGHMVKSLLIFGILVYSYKYHFKKIIKNIEKKERLNPNLSFSLKT